MITCGQALMIFQRIFKFPDSFNWLKIIIIKTKFANLKKVQYFIKVKFRRLLAVMGHCRVWIGLDYKIRKHYSTRFGRYCVLSMKHRESIYLLSSDTPHKTKFRRNIASKICPMKLKIYLNFASSLDLCCYNIVWTPTCFNGVCMYC